MPTTTSTISPNIPTAPPTTAESSLASTAATGTPPRFGGFAAEGGRVDGGSGSSAAGIGGSGLGLERV